MSPEIHLVLHNISFVITAIVSLGLALFSILNNYKSLANITFSMVMVSVVVYCVSHIFGVSTFDPEQSRSILMLNVSIIFITIFNTHCFFISIKRDKELWYMILLIYITGILLTGFYLIFPETFLQVSVPKMYFPNYYVPGAYHWVMRVIFNGIVPAYILFELFLSYRKAQDDIERNRLHYFFFSGIIGYVVGIIPVALVYDIPFDPIWGSFMILYSVPFLYSTVKYELLDIKVVAKRAFFYAVSITVVGVLVALFNFFNQWIIQNYPSFPFWISPLFSSVAIVIVAVITWRALRESDILKAEFITTVTHKFRTPLTYVKWATENMLKTNLTPENIEQVSYIRDANAKLVDLTNLLVSVSESENSYEYQLAKGDFSKIVSDAVGSSIRQMQVKDIVFNKKIDPGIMAVFDSTRIKFVIQVYVENATHYTTKGVIDIYLYVENNQIVFKVKDSGIGISKKEIPLLFTKFYRGTGAKLADTEGMGIGLFMSKKIILKHGGKVWAESEGEGKGSSFYFSLPLSK